MVEAITGWLLEWLLHVVWMGLVVWIVAIAGDLYFKMRSPVNQYGWSLFCFSILTLTLPLAAMSTQGKFVTRKTLPVKPMSNIDGDLLSDTLIEPDVELATLDLADQDFPKSEIVEIIGTSKIASANESVPLQTADHIAPPKQMSEASNDVAGRNPLADVAAANENRKPNAPSTWPSPRWVAILYIFGCCMMFVRLLWASAKGVRLAKLANPITDEKMMAIVDRTAVQIGLALTPIVAACDRVAVPMVVGVWKPMVLLPLGILSELSPEQLQTILQHELMHLRRRDVWVVLGQRIVESVLFFHPATWWLSRRLDWLRELCCDDAVLDLGTPPTDYARLLCQLAESSLNRFPADGLVGSSAIGSSQSLLVHRVRRILGVPSRHTATPMIQFAVLAIVICVPSLLLAITLIPGPEIAPGPAASTIVNPPMVEGNPETTPNVTSETSDRTFPRITGVVTDENGEPVSGVTILIREHNRKRGHYVFPSQPDRRPLEILATTRSTANGEFKFENVKIPNRDQYVDSPYPITIIAMDKKFAVHWQQLDFIPKRAIEFKMSIAQTLQLKLSDSKSLPLDNATVKLLGWMTPEDWQWIHDLDHIPGPIFSPVDYADKGLIAEDLQDSLKPWVKTDKSSVAIQSPAGMICVVRVSAPNKIPETVYLLSPKDQPLQEILSTNPKVPLFVSPTSKRLAPAAKLSIKITDPITKAPIAGATIRQVKNNIVYRTGRQQIDLSGLVSDGNGLIQINGLMPDEQFKIGIAPPAGSNYLAAATKSISLASGDQQELEFELETGVPITGRVLEAKSGDAVAGLKVSYAPLVLPNSDAIAPTATTSNTGEYRLIGMAAPGKIQLVDAPSRWHRSSISVNVNATESNTAPDLFLRKRPPYRPEYLRVQIAYPDGRPAKGGKVRFTDISKTGSYSQETKISDQNGNVNIDIKSFIYSDRRLLAHAVDQSQSFAGETAYDWAPQIKNRTDAKEYLKQLISKKKSVDDPVITARIKLQPMALVRGKVLTSEANQPVPRAVVRVHQRVGERGGHWRFVELTETDDQGNYQVKVFPGLPYFIDITHPNFDESRASQDQLARLGWGESKDITHSVIAKVARKPLSIRSFLPQLDAISPPPANTKSDQSIPELTRTSDQHIPLSVVDENSTALPKIKVDVWTEKQDSNQGKKVWSILESLTSDASGKIELYLPKVKDKYLWLIVNTKDGKGGCRKFHSDWFDPAKPSTKIVVKPLSQITIQVNDYDTGDPIAGCRVHGSLRNDGFTFDRTMTSHTDSSGQCTLHGLIPDMYTQMEITKDGYHEFGSFFTDADLRRRSGNTSSFQVELLSESSYRRAVAAGKLSLPDVSKMKPADAFHTLIKHYNQAKKRRRSTDSQDSQIDRFFNRMKNFPAQFYRDAVYQLAATETTDDEIAFDAMFWLLSNGGEYSDQYDQENTKLVLEFLQRFANHDRLDIALEHIERYHPQQVSALKNIVKSHPQRRVRGNAAITLVEYYQRTNGNYVIHPSKILAGTEIELNQQAERDLLNQILKDYADIRLTKDPSQSLAQVAKTRLRWFQTYGIGSTPPVLSAETISGAKISTKDFPGKFLVLHFGFKTSSPTLDAIRKINTHYADQVQVIGIIQGKFDKAKRTVQKSDIDWPVIWGGYYETYSRGAYSSTWQSAVSWGKEKLYHFSRYSTIVISPSGKIMAIGRQGDALFNFVETSIEQTRQ